LDEIYLVFQIVATELPSHHHRCQLKLPAEMTTGLRYLPLPPHSMNMVNAKSLSSNIPATRPLDPYWLQKIQSKETDPEGKNKKKQKKKKQ
jgi:hypothetical protein